MATVSRSAPRAQSTNGAPRNGRPLLTVPPAPHVRPDPAHVDQAEVPREIAYCAGQLSRAIRLIRQINGRAAWHDQLSDELAEDVCSGAVLLLGKAEADLLAALAKHGVAGAVVEGKVYLAVQQTIDDETAGDFRDVAIFDAGSIIGLGPRGACRCS